VREQEAHTPFMVCAPNAGSGRSEIFVQPQDLYATVASLAGAPTPGELDSHDALAIAQSGKPGPRRLALSGHPIRDGRPETIFCTVFDAQWQLMMAADPAACRLRRLGSTEDVTAEHSDVVARLRAEGIEELARRETDPALLDWIRSDGAAAHPTGCRVSDNLPAPAGYVTYFSRVYTDR